METKHAGPPEPKRDGSSGLTLVWCAGAALAGGATLYLAMHALASPVPAAVSAALGIASGLAWAASEVSASHKRMPISLGLAAAVLSILAAVCLLP